MGHHLIVQIHDSTDPLPKRGDINYRSVRNRLGPTTLQTVDLRDNTTNGEMEMTWFDLHKAYSFSKSGENQIIKFGGTTGGYNPQFAGFHQLTIESFRQRTSRCIILSLILHSAFKVHYEKIRVFGDKYATFSEHTAQIYEDALYVYGYDYEEMNVWRFNLCKI